jgi:hypothetical protein
MLLSFLGAYVTGEKSVREDAPFYLFLSSDLPWGDGWDNSVSQSPVQESSL